MPFYRINGLTVHVKFGGRRKPPAPCVALVKKPTDRGTWHCCAISGYLCDWPLSDGKTCNAPLCDAHARQVGRNRHYCPLHMAEHLHQQPQLDLLFGMESKA